MKIIKNIYIIIFLVASFFPIMASAQSDDEILNEQDNSGEPFLDKLSGVFIEEGAPDFGGSNTNDTPDVPVDGGLSILVLAGIGYGAKQLRKKKNN
jgi:hypothetical protein